MLLFRGNTMKTNIIGLVLFGLITVGLATGGFQYMNLSQTTENVDNTTLSTDVVGNAAEVAQGSDYVGYQVDPVLTTDEVLAIANSLEEVKNYTATYETENYAYFDGYGTWEVGYYQIDPDVYNSTEVTAQQATDAEPVDPSVPVEPNYGMLGYLIVWIDDATGDVLNIYEQEPYVPIDPETLQAAVNFLFMNYIPLLSDDFEIYGDQYGSDVYVSGYSSVQDLWFSASLTYETDFEISSLSANFEFGSVTHSFAQAEEIVLNTPEGQNLTSVVNTTSYISEYLQNINGTESYSFFISIYEDMGWDQSTYIGEPATGEQSSGSSDDVSTGNSGEPSTGSSSPGYAGDEFYYYSSGYIYAEVSDETGEIVYMDYNPAILPQSTEEEIMQLALSNSEIKKWVVEFPDYQSFIYFYGGYWEVSFSSYNGSNTESYPENYAYISIDDISHEVVYVYAPIPQEATHTEEEVLAVAKDNGLQEFLDINPDFSVEIYYDGFGYWWVSGFSSIYVEEYFYMGITDNSLEISYSYQSHMTIQPTMTPNEVLDLVKATDEYTSFISENPDANLYVYYISGEWNVEFYTNDYSQMILFVVDDATGTISYTYGYQGEPATREG